MDEPLSALDKNLREAMQIELRSMHERLGMTTVLVTHDQREALTMSDRVAVLRDGLLEQVDTAERVYNAPSSEFVASFMGESSFLDVQVSNGKARLDSVDLKTEICFSGDGPGLLVVRPEKIQLNTSEAAKDDRNYFKGVLETVFFQGESCLLTIKIDGGEKIHLRQMLNRESQHSLPDTGAEVSLSLHKQDTVVVPASSVNDNG